MADTNGTVDDEADRFRALFDAHLPAIWAYARRRSPSAADADDLAAETFATAWRRRRDLPPDDELRPWLFGVARNLLANQRRATERRGRLEARVRSVTTAEHLTVAGADTAIEDDRGLGEALASLAPDERELLLLRAWDGLAVTEIATLLGCTANAASIRLHRARRSLAEALERKGTLASRTSGPRPDAGEETP